MIYMRNITITTAKSATYLENVGSRECVNFIDAEIVAIKELYADLATVGRSEVVARLDKSIQLLELEKQKIWILNHDNPEPFEDRARRIILSLLAAVEGVSEGKLERMAQ